MTTAAAATAVDEERSRALRAALWMTLASALFAGMNVAARLGSVTLPWQEIALSRFAVGLPMMWIAARWRGVALRVEKPRSALLRSFFGTCSGICIFYALSQASTALGDVITLQNTSPIFVAILAGPILGERVRPPVYAALVLALCGVLAIVRPGFHVDPFVGGAALAAALFSSFAMMALRRLGKSESPEAIVLHFCAFATVTFAALSVPVWRTPDAKTLGLVVLTGLLGNSAQLCMTRAYSLDAAARVAVLGYSGVAFTRLFAGFVIGEIPSALGVAGSLLIIASGAIVAFSGARKA